MPILVWNAVTLLVLSSLSLEQEMTFVVEPENQTVAARNEARFDCAVTTTGSAYLSWIIYTEGEPITLQDKTQTSRYMAEWYTDFNSTLHFIALANDNGTRIACVTATMESHYRKEAYLRIAGPPLKPANFSAKYHRTEHMISLRWQHPFTQSQTFPILEYTANTYCSHTNRRLLEPISIDGSKTSQALYLNESELCTCDAIYVNLTAKNSIGESSQAQAFVRIFQEYDPFPINTSLSMQPDGRTLVAVAFPRPSCFTQGLQSSIMIEEVSFLNVDVPHISLDDSNEDIEESFTLMTMKPDALYSVTVYLNIGTMNMSSMPVIVSLSDADAHSTKGNDNEMVLIIAASIGAFLFCATAVGVTTCVITIISLRRRGKREKYSVSMQMEHNPIYEGPLYETIAEFSTPPSATTLNECHVFKGQLHATEALRYLSDSSNGDVHMNEYMTHTHGTEDDYMVMHPVLDSPVQVQTDV